tara:strand:- start:251 stop:943 length:693 start_codon:yes stop_codon:yes gene_type:complete
MTDGKELPQEVIDLYWSLGGDDQQDVNLSSLSSTKRARFISFCRSRGIDHTQLSGSLQTLSLADSSSALRGPGHLGAVGIDLVCVSELFPIAPMDLKSDASMSEIFSMREIAYAQTKPQPLETLTGIFALKEAIVKTREVSQTVMDDFKSLEISHDADGVPSFDGFAVSISHCSGFATAIAISLRTDQSVSGATSEQSPEKRSSSPLIRGLILGTIVLAMTIAIYKTVLL